MTMSEGGMPDVREGGVVEVNGRHYRVVAVRTQPLPGNDPLNVRADDAATTEYELTVVNEAGLNPESLPELSVWAYLWAYPSVLTGLALLVISMVVSGLYHGGWSDLCWFAIMVVGFAVMFKTPSRRTVNQWRQNGDPR